MYVCHQPPVLTLNKPLFHWFLLFDIGLFAKNSQNFRNVQTQAKTQIFEVFTKDVEWKEQEIARGSPQAPRALQIVKTAVEKRCAGVTLALFPFPSTLRPWSKVSKS